MAEDWKYELFYYGNASWPSDSTWRSRGDEHHVLIEIERVSSLEDAEVLWSYYSERGWLEPFYSEHKKFPELRWLHAWKPSTEEYYRQASRGAMENRGGGFLMPDDHRWTPLKP